MKSFKPLSVFVHRQLIMDLLVKTPQLFGTFFKCRPDGALKVRLFILLLIFRADGTLYNRIFAPLGAIC